MEIKLLGVRGSVISLNDEFREFGCNTQCVCVTLKDKLIVFDAGSGIINVESIIEKYKNIDIYLTHYHLDHISSLLMFTPLFIEGYNIKIYTPKFNDVTGEEILRRLFVPPYWPVTFDDVKANLEIININPGDIVKDDKCTIETMSLCHPGGSVAYKVLTDDTSFVYLFDHEDDLFVCDIIEFIKNADLLICDAPYTKDEYKFLKGYGHSTIERIEELKIAANVKKAVISHHSPSRTDKELREFEEKYTSLLFGREGDVFTI